MGWRFDRNSFQLVPVPTKYLASMVTTSNQESSVGTSSLTQMTTKVEEEMEVGEQQFPSDLWSRLPEDLIERILAKLPFASLMSFCSVCKSWKNSIVSGHPRLVFFHAGKLVVYNPNNGAWESVPLPFLPMDRFGPFSLVASAGGMLCFRTNFFEDFIVCNPLTETYTRVEMPWGDRSSKEACMPKFLRNLPESKIASPRFVVGMAVDPDTGHFKLTVACCVSEVQGRVLVYDSLSSTWKRVVDVPHGGLGFPMHVSYSGNVYSIGWDHDNERKLLKYDPRQKTWTSILLPKGCEFPWTLVEHNGKTSLMTGDPKSKETVAFLELHDSGAVPWPTAKSLPLTRVFEALQLEGRDSDRIEALSCSGLREYMFFTATKRSDSRSSSRLCLRAGVHNSLTNSAILSDWNESGWLRGCPSAVCQIFQPSS